MPPPPQRVPHRTPSSSRRVGNTRVGGWFDRPPSSSNRKTHLLTNQETRSSFRSCWRRRSRMRARIQRAKGSPGEICGPGGQEQCAFLDFKATAGHRPRREYASPRKTARMHKVPRHNPNQSTALVRDPSRPPDREIDRLMLRRLNRFPGCFNPAR
jgi:hypothetical protein